MDAFVDSLTYSTPIYHHYLGEYISPKFKSIFYNITNFIFNNKLSNLCNYCDVNFNFNFSTHTRSPSILYNNNISNDDIFTIISKSKYTIIDINNKSTLLIFVKDSNYNLLYFNPNDDFFYKNKTYYVPYMWYKILLKDKTKIESIMLLKTLYNMLSFKNKGNESQIFFSYNELKNKYSTKYSYDFNYLINIIEYIKNNLEPSLLTILSKYKYMCKLNGITYNNFLDFYNYINKNKTHVSDSVYAVDSELPDYSIYITNVLFNYTKSNIYAFDDKLNYDNINSITNIHNLKDEFFDNTRFFYINKDIYVLRVSNNALGWFTIYWATLFCYFIENRYNEFINNTHTLCLTKIKEIFNYDIFVKNIVKQHKIHTMINIWNKYNDIGILDKRINLNDIRDDLLLEGLRKISATPADLPNYDHIFNNVFIKNISTTFKNKPSYILNNFISNYDIQIQDKFHQFINEHILYFYKLFCYTHKSNNHFFNEECNYNSALFNASTPPHMSTLPEYTILINYLNKYKQIHMYDKESSTIHYDFILKYYFHAIFIYGLCDAYKQYDITQIDNIDLHNNDNMYKFCVFLHKFELFLFSMICVNKLYATHHNIRNIIYNYFFSDKYTSLNDKFKNLSHENLMWINLYFPPALYTIIPPNIHDYISEAEYNTCDLNIFKSSIDYMLNNPHLLFDSPNKYAYNDFYNNSTHIINYLIFDIKKNNQIKKKIFEHLYTLYYNCVNRNFVLEIFYLFLHDFNPFPFDRNTHGTLSYYSYIHLLDESKLHLHKRFLNIRSFADKYHSNSSLNILNNGLIQCKSVTDYIKYMWNNIDQFDKYIYIKNIILKHIPHTLFKNNDIIITTDQSINSNITFNIFSHRSFFYFLCNKPVCSIQNTNKEIIYVFYEDFYLKFIKNMYNDTYTIYIDDNYVYPNSMIQCAFKQVLPSNCIYFIYMKDNIYHIRYFFNYHTDHLSENEIGILGNTFNLSYSDVITINPNNLFFPNYLDETKYLSFGKTISATGPNMFNHIYIEDQSDLFLFNKKTQNFYPQIDLKNDLKSIDYTNVIFVNKNSSSFQIINSNLKKRVNQNQLESCTKLFKKIRQCGEIHDKTEINSKLSSIISNCDSVINNFISELDTTCNNYVKLFDNYEKLYDYLLHIKIKNVCDELIQTSNENLCSQIKIYEDRFNLKINKFKYIFEAFFEFYSGIEISNEQFNRYQEIINTYETYVKKPKTKYHLKTYNKIFNVINANVNEIDNCIQKGGSYPLHHFMMGKGKSAVLTPLLTLYFTIIHDKTVYIIVPEHLIKQTHFTIDSISYIFKIKNKITIISDSDIKKMFLEGKFHEMSQQKRESHIFLIDEFDSLLDPLKSNYNIIQHYTNIDVSSLYNILNQFVNEYISNNKLTKFNKISDPLFEYYNNDCMKIVDQLNSNSLKYNINWGIHSTKYYAIPFANKDKPMNDSNFSSSILTIFLTLLYYNAYKDYDKISKYIYDNKLCNMILNISDMWISIDQIKKCLENDITKYNETVKIIINTIKFADIQLNTSFVDIINIDGIYKIGYSGTINIDLPDLLQNDKFNVDNIVVDYDEQMNVYYAINNSKIIQLDNPYNYNIDLNNIRVFLDELFNIKQYKYDVLIDEAGLFKNVTNDLIATELFNIFKNRSIIFMAENDDKLVIDNNGITKYNKYIKYDNPFIYYSQSHIVGIDIDQEKYPNLKGLCILDNKSTYTNVAQAIFRLRKLNMGHTIDFYCIGYTEKNGCKLLKRLKKNENINKNAKVYSLIYQTIKSIIRKRKSNNATINTFIQNYTENIKYYYKEFKKYNIDIIDNPLMFDDFFKNIFSYSDIFKNNELKTMFSKINNDRVIYELVYNMGTSVNDTAKQNDKDVDNIFEQEKILTTSKISLKLNENKIYQHFILAILIKQESLINIIDNIDDYIINIVDNLYCMPNIFCNYNGSVFSENYSGIVCAYINNKYVLFPFYNFMYFINKKCPIFNLQLECIYVGNGINIKNIIQQLEKYTLFHLFSTNDQKLYDDTKNDVLTNSIIYDQLILQKKITNSQMAFLKKYESLMINHDKYVLIDNSNGDTYNYKSKYLQTKTDELGKYMLQKMNPKIKNHIIKTYLNDNLVYRYDFYKYLYQ